MKKIIFLLILALFLVACNSNNETQEPYASPETYEENNEDEPTPTPEPTPPEPLRVIATIFPQFDFVRQIARDRVDLSMLISPGAESHGFEPTPRDMIALGDADLLIYIGGDNDAWVAPSLAAVDRSDMHTVALLSLVQEVIAHHVHECDGDECDLPHLHTSDDSCDHHSHDCTDDHDCGHHSHDCTDDHDCDHHAHDCTDDHDCDHHAHDCANGHHSHDCDDDDCDHHSHDCDDHHGHQTHVSTYDEHVWTCPRNAIIIVNVLANVLADLDPANAYYFMANAEAFIEDLRALDRDIVSAVAEGARRSVVFGDRFPFAYFVNTYGLIAHTAFDGCCAGTQASPATIAQLINTVNDENIPVIFHIELSNMAIANTIAAETEAVLLEFHSAHNVTPGEFNAGVTYLELMRRNLNNLWEALR